jgi:4-amino-4-deoxy-L-arabinose transferase-like glycosyltransferase
MTSLSAAPRGRRSRIASLTIPASYLFIGAVALALLTQHLGSFVTLDEIDFWLRRSEQFLAAIQTSDFAATALSTHPGVTTMWLGSLGILLRRGLAATGWPVDQSFPTTLALMRLPVVLTHVLGILVGYGLLRRMLPAATAALAAFLWVVDPFVIGYSRLLHVDALAGTFATLSLLAACLYWHHDPRRRWLALSGICAGLAILSKSPALVLLPVFGLIALAANRRPTTNDHPPPTTREHSWSLLITRHSSLLAALTWGVVVAVTLFALWPALWVSPIAALQQLQSGVEDEGAQPHMLGNFFMGRADGAPGPLFYPVALALHLFPRTLAGLLLLLLAWRKTQPHNRRDLAALAGFVVLFVLALSLFPKKFDRYMAPVFPALNILAAYGLTWEAAARPSVLGRFALRNIVGAGHMMSLRLAVLMILTLSTTTSLGAYSIDAFNPLLGGVPAGANTFLVGWGEGMEQAAAWLNRQPDITGVLTVSTSTRALQPYLRPGAQSVTPQTPQLPEKAGYIVIYIRDVMRGAPGPPFDQFFGRVTPLHTVRIGGVDFVWIYQAPPPVASARPADFGPDIHLRGFEWSDPPHQRSPASIKLFWKTRDRPAADYTLFAHLIGPDGKRYAQVDLPYPTSQWDADRFVTTMLPLAVPVRLPAGCYRLFIGLYDQASGQRLRLAINEGHNPALDGPDALLLTQIALPMDLGGANPAGP